MANRTDIHVDFTVSPRLAHVDAGSNSVSVQDSHDTLTVIQESPEGMNEAGLVKTAGGENLGGGTTVGLTSTLQNLQYAFARTDSRTQGTATSASASGVYLIDSTATFITDGVVRGDWIINFRDFSVGEVLSVIDENTIQTTYMTDGTTNDFQVGDDYKVWKVEKCELLGGNIVAIDEVGSDIEALFTSFGRFAVRTSASSATATSQEALEASVLGGEVAYDPTSIYTIDSAVEGVLGSREFPLNNIEDVHTLAVSRGIRDVRVMSNALITTVDLSDAPHNFIGDSPFIELNIDSSTEFSGCSVWNTTLSGELDGLNTIRDCKVGNVSNMNGYVKDCSFAGIATLNGETMIMTSYSNFEGTGSPTFIPYSNVLKVREWHGSLTISGMTGGVHTIELYGGAITFDNTCTGGTVYVRGNYSTDIVDNSTGTVIVDQTVNNYMPTRIWAHSASSVVAGSMGESLRRAGHDNIIYINENQGFAGTAYPIGLFESSPVNNMVDALTIAAREDIKTIQFAEDGTIPNGSNIDGYQVFGSHATKSQITVETGVSTVFTQFMNCSLTGALNGQVIVRDSKVEDLTGFEGILHQVLVSSGVEINGAQPSAILNSFFAGRHGVPSELNLGGTGHSLSIEQCSGHVKIANKTGPETLVINGVGLHVTLNGTVTGGRIECGGTGHLWDQNGDNIPTRTWNGVVIENEFVDGNKINEIWKDRGMDKYDPYTTTPTSFGSQSGDIDIAVTGNPNSSITLTRQ